MTDARFEDVTPTDCPLRLRAETAEDLAVLSALLQDGVGKTADVIWARGHRRLVVLVNRFRWEDCETAERERRPYERVQTALTVEDVSAVHVRGLSQDAPDAVYSLLAVTFEPAEDGAGRVVLTMAGDAALSAEVEALDVTLIDVTRPWEAKAPRPPRHET
jgi:hypothetical protein